MTNTPRAEHYHDGTTVSILKNAHAGHSLIRKTPTQIHVRPMHQVNAIGKHADEAYRLRRHGPFLQDKRRDAPYAKGSSRCPSTDPPKMYAVELV